LLSILAYVWKDLAMQELGLALLLLGFMNGRKNELFPDIQSG
jgi:hypothetical protein